MNKIEQLILQNDFQKKKISGEFKIIIKISNDACYDKFFLLKKKTDPKIFYNVTGCAISRYSAYLSTYHLNNNTLALLA